MLFILAFLQAGDCFYSNASILALCYNHSLELTLWVNDKDCIPPRHPQFIISLTNGSTQLKYSKHQPIVLDEQQSLIIKDIPLTDTTHISGMDYRDFLLRVITGIVTITDSAVSEFAATYTLKKVDILCSNYSSLWAQTYLTYSLPITMGENPLEEPKLCVKTYGPIGMFPESSLLYFSASLILLSELSGTTITVPIQRGKVQEEFKYWGTYYHDATSFFCYNCSTVSASEKDFCEKLISNFASLDLHIAALQLSSKYERTTRSLPTIQFHAHQLIDNYYHYGLDKYQLYSDTNYYPIFMAENGLHFVVTGLEYIFDKPQGTTYSVVSFILYSLDGYHLNDIHLKLSYSYVHPITGKYLWLLVPKDVNYNTREVANLALHNKLKGELVVKHMNGKDQIQGIEIASFSLILPSCFDRTLVILHQSSISILLNLSMTPMDTMNCLIANSNHTSFTSVEYIDNKSALYIDEKVQMYAILYYFPRNSDINRDMHLIGAFVISTEVSAMETEVTMDCAGNWIGYSKYDWPMSCLHQLNQARHHMMNGDLRAIVRVHNDYQLVDLFVYDEIRSTTQFIYVLIIVSVCCIFVVFIYYCILLCKFYRRLLR